MHMCAAWTWVTSTPGLANSVRRTPPNPSFLLLLHHLLYLTLTLITEHCRINVLPPYILHRILLKIVHLHLLSLLHLHLR